MLNSKLILISLGAVGTLTVGGIAGALISKPSQPIEQATAASDESEIAVQVADYSTTPQPSELKTLVTIAYPFDNSGTPTTQFAVDDIGGPLTSVSYRDIEGYELILPAPVNFNQVGLSVGTLSPDQMVEVVYQYKFHQDATVSWELGSNIPTEQGSWESHPETITKTTGSSLTVTYRSNDGGATWVGSVNNIY